MHARTFFLLQHVSRSCLGVSYIIYIHTALCVQCCLCMYSLLVKLQMRSTIGQQVDACTTCLLSLLRVKSVGQTQIQP